MTFFNNVKRLVKEQNKTIDGLMKEALGPQSGRDTFNGWQKRTIVPRGDDCLKLARTLHVTVEFLLTGEDSNIFSPRIMTIARACERAPEDELHVIEKILGVTPPGKNNTVSAVS